MSVPVGRVRNLGSEMCMPDRHSEMAMISFEGFGGTDDIAARSVNKEIAKESAKR